MSCCNNPPCNAKQKKCKSSSSGTPIPLNEYKEIHTTSFLPLNLSKRQQKTSSSKKKMDKNKKNKKNKRSKKNKTKKVYLPKKSKWLTAALLASVISPLNQDVNVQPRIDKLLGPIDPSIPENIISRRKHELRMDKKRMTPIQENQQVLEDEAFTEVLNEYRNNPRANPKNRHDPNRPTYQETRNRLQKKRMDKQTQKNTKHRGRKKKHTKKKKKQ